MSVLVVGALYFLSFAAVMAFLLALQTWVRLRVSTTASKPNFEACVRIAFVCGVWMPFVVRNEWNDYNSVWASLADQRAFFGGALISLLIASIIGVLKPWAYLIRPWLLAANLFSAGLYYGLFVGTASWPGSFQTVLWLIGPAAFFGTGVFLVLRSRPNDVTAVAESSVAEPGRSGSRTA